ncbi:MAG: SpoIIE family protein phosphatase [Bacteroidetes bacterium]|jgi:hypothetical protein|nr:SpoIIE family protein phosphatase [Bacteroidota bacterium]
MRIQRREAVLLVLLAALGLAAFLMAYPRVLPFMQRPLALDRAGAILKTQSLAEALDLDENDFAVHNAVVNWENRRLAFLRTYDEADSSARSMYRHHQPPIAWNVILEHEVRDERFEALIAPDGHILQYLHALPPDAPGGRLSPDTARARALRHLHDRLPFDFATHTLVDEQQIQREARTDHVFTWQRTVPELDSLRLRLTATVQGDDLAGWSMTAQLPPAFEQRYESDLSNRRIGGFAEALVLTLLWVSALVAFAIRFRAGEVGLRGGFIVALLMLVLYVAINLNALPSIKQALTELGQFNISGITFTVLGGVFVPMALFFVWSAGESFAREAWPEKLWVIDGLFAGNFFFPSLGSNTLRGATLGFFQLGAAAIWSLAVVELAGAVPIGVDVHSQALSAYVPVLFSPAAALQLAITIVAYVLLYAAAALKYYAKRRVLVVGLTLFFGFAFFQIGDFSSVWWSFGTSMILTGLSLLFFIRYDLFTVIIGQFFSFLALLSTLFLMQDATSYLFAGGVGWGILMGFVGLAVYAYLQGTPVDEGTVVPTYVQHITERERLKMELDIARRAQLRMLPREIPSLEGMEIAAFSEPAREVGGDYFDFFAMAPGRLGLAIGDISGKGMPAALYMTLLKGSLQSRVEATSSPREVLSHINRTFFASAEANTFATLFFGVLHVEERQLQFARAGHNPFVRYRACDESLDLIRPPGIGLGLEAGGTFDRVTEEAQIPLDPGDVLVFYTDGLVEARNDRGEEFGDDRLLDLVRTHHATSAQDLLDHIRAAYRSFVDGQEAHDDMTCLVLRIE